MQTSNSSGAPRLLSRREACERLKISLSTYKTLANRGAIREVAIGNRGRRLPEAEVDRFIAAQMATDGVEASK